MGGRRKQTSENSLKGHRMSPIRNGRGVNGEIRRNRRLSILGKQIQGGKRMNTPDARRIFEAIAMILSNRNDGVRVQLSEIKTKAAKAS